MEDEATQIARRILGTPTHDLVSAVAAALRAERERAAQIALDLGWRADASDAMKVAATTIAHAIRA